MSISLETKIGILSGTITFALAYFNQVVFDNADQFLALVCVILLDGFFGIIAGIKREGFQTRKGLRVLTRIVSWIFFLLVLLVVEKAFPATSWLSEVIVVPFVILQLLSALKNASMAGFISNKDLNTILDRIDNHKGKRQE